MLPQRVTGPLSRHLATALVRTYRATPEPKWVVAMGDCACTGGLFGACYASCGPVANVIPGDVAIPGCPPDPQRLLAGILAAVKGEGGRLEERLKQGAGD